MRKIRRVFLLLEGQESWVDLPSFESALILSVTGQAPDSHVFAWLLEADTQLPDPRSMAFSEFQGLAEKYGDFLGEKPDKEPVAHLCAGEFQLLVCIPGDLKELFQSDAWPAGTQFQTIPVLLQDGETTTLHVYAE